MNKKALMVLATSFLLVGCGAKGTPTTSGNTNNSVVNTTNNINNNNTDGSIPPVDNDLLKADAYKNVQIEDFKFEERVIESKDDVTFDDFFNLHNKVNIDIKMSDDQLRLLESDFIESAPQQKTEKYRHAEKVTITLTNNGNTFTWEFDDVGIRQKGNMSRDHILVNGQIQTFHIKLSFDETWDDPELYDANELTTWSSEEEKLAREDRNFLGVSGLDTKWNSNYDETFVKEIYTSMLYRANGIIAQHITLGEMNLSTTSGLSKNMGLYKIYEPATKTLVKRTLQNDNINIVNMPSWKDEKKGTEGVEGSSYGDLYKCSYGYGAGSYSNGADLTTQSAQGNRIGVNSNDGIYCPVYNRKTNKDANDNDARLRETITKINENSYSTIESYVDLKYFAIEEAVAYVIGNPDDLRNNYNNYMIYLRRTDGKMVIIPIDYDRTFGCGGVNWNPDGNNMANSEVFSTKAAGKNKNISAKIFMNTILSSQTNEAKAIYLNQVKALKASSWLKEDNLTSLYTTTKANYGSKYYFDYNSAVEGNMTTKAYLTSKLNMIDLNYTLLPQETTNGNAENNNQTTTYTNLYLAGYLGKWTTKDYPLVNVEKNIYEVQIDNVQNSEFEFKFNNGENWNEINWGKASTGDFDLSQKGGDNFKASGLEIGSTIVIRVDLNTMKVSIIKK